MQINYSNNSIDYDINDKSHITGLGIIKEFEQNFLSECGGKYALAASNCTSSILISLVASGVKHGDEVIISNISWGQTLAPVLLLGAMPVLCDVKENSFLIDPECVNRLISPKTKAVISSHLFGYPCDLSELRNITTKHRIKLIVDAAQGFGSMYNNKPIGNFGDFVAFSLGPNKNLTCGEGSVLICNNKDLFENAILFSQHPLRSFKEIDNIEKRKKINTICMNYRLHPLLAKIANDELLKYNEFLLYENYYTTLDIVKNSMFGQFMVNLPLNSCNNMTKILLYVKKQYQKELKHFGILNNLQIFNEMLKPLCDLIPENYDLGYNLKNRTQRYPNSELTKDSIYSFSILKRKVK